ncbi:MAG: hypothetical protein ABI548_29590 [Polyangiaceae bacterium]
MLPLLVAVLLQTRFAAPDAGLATAALASPRPRECRAAANGEGGLWSRLRGADAQRYCELLARGYARLQETPREALSAAQAAQSVAGALPAVHVLSGRALMRLGQSGNAFEEFAKAEAQDTQAFVDPKALHDYAQAASLSGNSAAALRLYRLLVSRVSLLNDAREVAFVHIEAAAHVLASLPAGPAGADEALGYLAQARREALGLSVWVDGLRLVALQRRGPAEANIARAAAPSLAAQGAALSEPSSASASKVPLMPPGMLEALRAAFTAPAPRQAKAR